MNRFCWSQILKKPDGKNFHIYLLFLWRKRSSDLEFLQASWGRKGASLKFMDQKSSNFRGSGMLGNGLISDWKMKFLQAVIDKFSGVYNNFKYRCWFFQNIFKILIGVPKPEPWHPTLKINFFLNFFLIQILKFLLRISMLDWKILSDLPKFEGSRVLPYGVISD